MIITILDAAGVQQSVIAKGQESVVDKSGTITATGVSQLLMAANANRSGFLVQNLGSNPMHINAFGVAADDQTSFTIAPGAFFPPENYPITTGAITILGTIGDKFAAKEW